MQGKDVARALVEHGGLTLWSASKALGRSGQYLDTVARRGSVPSLDTAAAIADVCGCDLVLVDRATGDTVARVDPPARDNGEG